MITLKTLKWNNCFSYGSDNILELDDAPLVQILGVNGTGKSSIPLIIEEALYNKNSKGVKKADIPNRYIDAGYDIYLKFLRDDTVYEVITERRGNKLKVKLLKEGADISSHTATNTYKTIQEVLGLDFKTFSQLVYQSTNTSLQFLSATDTTRKKFLVDLLSLEIYLDFLEVFKVAHKEVQSKVSAISSRIDTIQSWLDTHFLTDTNILEPISERIETEDTEKTLRDLQAEFENLDSQKEKILTNNRFKKELAALDTSMLSDTDIGDHQSYDTLQEQFGGLQSENRNLKATLRKYADLGSKCPTCDQPVDRTFIDSLMQETTEAIEATAKEAERLHRKIQKIKEDNAAVVKKQRIQRDWEELFRRIDKSLPESIEVSTDMVQKLKETREALSSAKKKNKEIEEENSRRVAHNARIVLVKEQTEAFTAQLDEATVELVDVENQLSRLDILKKSFGTNGILAYKIENLVKELEDLTNKYLAELSDGRFTLGFVVSNDKLNVEITDEGITVDISALSSGELARVNTATLIAIRKLMSSISKSRINVLFLDEVIAVLDDTGREKLVEILLEEENLNTYIVSHHWEHPLLAKLNIVKQDDISFIER